MPKANASLTTRKPTARSRVSNGAELLPGIDGRSPTARRFRDIGAAIATDQGGVEVLSEARLQLIRRFAACACLAENMEAELVQGKQIDIMAHSSLCSTMVRIGSRIGIDRRARNVSTLKDYLADVEKENITDVDPDDSIDGAG
jgi:hypothetical protein